MEIVCLQHAPVKLKNRKVVFVNKNTWGGYCRAITAGTEITIENTTITYLKRNTEEWCQ